MTTAIADWSTFDTIGGYMPDKMGHYRLLRCFSKASMKQMANN